VTSGIRGEDQHSLPRNSLSRGMRLPVISRDEKTVTVEYLGGNYKIPIELTDLR
jgi:hypothetical protein